MSPEFHIKLCISRSQYLTGPVSHGSSISRGQYLTGPVSQGPSISRVQYLTDPVSHGPTVSHHSISRHSSISRQYLTLPGSQLFFKISQLFSNSEISQKARISACLTRISRRMETWLHMNFQNDPILLIFFNMGKCL